MSERKKTKIIILSMILCVVVIIISNACIKSHKRMSKRIKETLNNTKTIVSILTADRDITKFPKAKGDLRLAQRTSIAILKRFDEIAKRHNIVYWLDWGTLLGAVRHGGFIPWDDDIDIAIEREEYERIIPILEKEFSGNGFFIQVSGITSYFIRILQHILIYSHLIKVIRLICLTERNMINFQKILNISLKIN